MTVRLSKLFLLMQCLEFLGTFLLSWICIDSELWIQNLTFVFVLRYTKALEVIKKLHKDQALEIKAYKLKLENLQTLKDAAYKVFYLSFRVHMK